jgi:hypothetical protein
MEYKVRFWKKSFYTGQVDGPYTFTVKASSLKKALEKAKEMLLRMEVCLTSSVVEKAEIHLKGKWKEIKSK